ncbi:hypothetical protein SAMN05443429_102146 [Cruoricaptor ignavus]|uniref:Protein required for attachment to host cells n=1 Tax=Cruoricaptor ignavus TaxID=1118202 RepID=A0A1M6BWC7_9FLAO|nr:hypothetical protein [Cruoricaptor ignavus]QOR74106.1 hypothetical protein IMZ16_01275 [Cruoricaptor ignavus]SHI53055.1 hypothetical protein SAMN05443429_102146 [Cruoricaptor ignavus]
MQEKRLAGVWLDGQKAIVVKNHDAQSAFKFFLCDPVKRDVQHGNSNENAANNHEQTSKNKFFKEIEKLLTNTEELWVTGPGTAQEELKKHLHETAQFKNLKVSLGTASNMNDQQVLDAVKEHFGE